MNLFSLLFGPPSPSRFAGMMIREMQRAGAADDNITFDAERFALNLGSEDRQVFLGNAYREYCAAPRRERREVLRRYAAIPTEPVETFEEAAANLLPMVKDRAFLDHVKQQALGYEFAWQPMCEHLIALLAIDRPDRVQFLGAERLEDWGKSFDECMAIARENLWKISNEDFVTVGPGVFISPWQDNHDASRLVLYELIWQLPVQGRHVACVPGRDVLIVTGSEDTDGLQALANLATTAMTEDLRPLTAIPFVLEDRQWVPFMLAQENPAYETIRLLLVRAMAQHYADQAQMLEQENAREEREVYIAEYAAMDHPERGVQTWCTWPTGVRTWLPKTDLVGLGDEEGRPLGFARWDQLAEVLGDGMKPMDVYPQRFEVNGTLGDEQLEALELETLQ